MNINMKRSAVWSCHMTYAKGQAGSKNTSLDRWRLSTTFRLERDECPKRPERRHLTGNFFAHG